MLKPAHHIVLFAGHSLSALTAEQQDRGWQLRPPVRRGDAVQILREDQRPDVVAVLDGSFHQTLSIGHRELLALIDAGIMVFGAASMGALRAVELSRFGMVGVGRIFDHYLAHPETPDSEVAAIMAEPLNYRQISLPLMCLRFALEALCADELLTDGERCEILAREKSVFFADRTYASVSQNLEASVRDPERRSRISKFLLGDDPRLDQKKLDGLALTAAIDAHLEGRPACTTLH